MVVSHGRVRLHVRAQVGSIGERLAAVDTTERFLTGVRSQVSPQKPRSRERLVAHGAPVLEIMGEDVHGQGGHADVDLATVGTLLGVLAVEAAVRLTVS